MNITKILTTNFNKFKTRELLSDKSLEEDDDQSDFAKKDIDDQEKGGLTEEGIDEH